MGGGFALGAALARPDKRVVIIYGDGAAGFSLMEFDTFARHKVPIVAVVGNDSCWTQIEREQVPMFASDVSTVLEYCAYDKVAQGLGGVGKCIDHPDADIAQDVRDAQRTAHDTGKPVLLNVLIGKTSFREGSLSV